MNRGAELAARKAALRVAVLSRRDGLDGRARQAWSETILAAVRALEGCRRARVVLSYSSFGSEPSTDTFNRAILAGGQTLVLPRVDRAARVLALHRVDDPGRQLRPGTWGIHEPDPARAPAVSLAEVEFVLVPGVAFDSGGGRLGYGGGYYDRLLGAVAAGTPLVAGAFEAQMVDAVPMAPGDRRVDRVITEARMYPG
jgi:5-formyltetrahydrofolate cyclo-ligase